MAVALLIDSDEEMAFQMCRCLTGAGHEVTTVTSIEHGLTVVRSSRLDMLMLNLQSEPNALAALPILRRCTDARIYTYTDRPAPGEISVALRLGADDCQLATISCEEVAARVEVLLRRVRKRAADMADQPAMLNLGQLCINHRRRCVQVGGRRVNLTATEFRVLEYLAEHADRVVERKELSIEVWGSFIDGVADSHRLEVHLGRLRRKLAEARLQTHTLATVRGRGYVFQETGYVQALAS